MMTHEPGDELDALVAEHFLGWIPGQPPPPDSFCREAQVRLGDLRAPVWWKRPDGGYQCGLCQPPPEFSTSIADAWHVVEHLAQRKPRAPDGDRANQFSIRSPVVAEGRWWVGWTIESVEGSLVVIEASAPTVPHAVSLAALNLHDAEPEEET